VPRPPRLSRRRLDEAVAHLRDADPKLARVIDAVGPCTMLPAREGSHFAHLARAIVYQQLSGSAAATIHGRVEAQLGGVVEPQAVARAADDALRAAGLSMAKTRALRDLAEQVLDGRLDLASVDAIDDAAVIDALVQVRGIGPWTAQMFLMFRLGRPDVLPVLDLGVRKGAQRMHRLRTLPDAARLERLAEPWRPWRSVASWYCWRALEL
jgi:3-methyladenine DNA glycosylase/8-oxoguanine DNA glycosylase